MIDTLTTSGMVKWVKKYARPIGNKLFVQLVSQEDEGEGLIIYKTVVPKSRFAKVLRIGPLVDGISPGDTVILGKTLGLEEADDSVIIVSQDDLSGYIPDY